MLASETTSLLLLRPALGHCSHVSCCRPPAAGVEPAQVQERVENHLKSLLIKHFDPQKADSIFTVEGEVRYLGEACQQEIGVLFILKHPGFALSDARLAGADDRTHHMERSFLQTGRGPSRLFDAQFHCEGKTSGRS